MSWIVESNLNWRQLLFFRLLRCGTIPKHIAFIMDGNRRFAKKNTVRELEGHTKGFDKLAETFQWCLGIGIHEVTFYAFSIENVKRSKEEVHGLLELCREKFKLILEEKEKLMERGIKILTIGNTSLFPPDIMKLIAEAELLTKNNAAAVLNIAFFYTAQDEITHSINRVAAGVKRGSLTEADVNMTLFTKCLYTRDSPPPELIIRTSGETRLSDFLLCQGAWSYLHFTGALWPELSAWNFLWAIFKYQVHSHTLKEAREGSVTNDPLTPKALKFIENIDKEHVNYLQQALNA